MLEFCYFSRPADISISLSSSRPSLPLLAGLIPDSLQTNQASGLELFLPELNSNDLPLANLLVVTRSESVNEHSFADICVSFIVCVVHLAFVLHILVDLLDCASDSSRLLA